MTSSQISGFYRLDPTARRARLAELTGLTDDDLAVLTGEQGLDEHYADRMVENALGVLGMPLGLCVNLQVNGRDVLMPMAVEEPSVLAACSFASKLLRAGGGVHAEVSEPLMIGQIQVMDVPDFEAAKAAVLGAKDDLLSLANSRHNNLVRAGGGAVDVEIDHLPKVDADDPLGDMMVVHLVVDVRDAMGANAINSMCERLAPHIEELTSGRVALRILSNLTDRRTVSVVGKVPFAALEGRGKGTGEDVARAIEEASVFAERCPYRAATHNKGIMNGIDAALIAFGQDWRAVEAGAHAYAAKDGRYTAMAKWRVEDGHLVGRMTVPMAVGTVGGVYKVHPTVQVTRKVAHIESTQQLAAAVTAVGLAQNLAAIRALAAEGIQSGHMRLHARNVAAEAGAQGAQVHEVAARIADAGTVNIDAARAALADVRSGQGADASATNASTTADLGDVTARFKALGETYMSKILDLTERVMAEVPGGDGTLPKMCRYHYETGGKRLRALLPLLTAEAFGDEPEKMVPFGAACEMLHNATLVHDDLQDGDAVRRGNPTVWKKYGEPQAINLGDAMFYYTILLEQRLEVPVHRRERCAARILKETLRVIDGQEREFGLKQTEGLTLEAYFRMVEGKTSGLFALPMAGAAEVLGAPRDVVDGLAEAAHHMGVLFQIQDDVLDIYGEKGRDMRGSDIAEGKRSALVVHALENASEADKTWLAEVLDRPREQTSESDVLAVVALFERTGSLRFTLDEMERRRVAALGVPALQDHPRLIELIGGFCDLFLAPIQFLVDDPKAVVDAILEPIRLCPGDAEFCFEVLPKVSRTFALSIEALPSELRNPVCVAYLLCRIVDTIEDEAKIAPDKRVELFDAFDALMADDERPEGELAPLSAAVDLGANEAEKQLMARSGAVFRTFRALPERQRDAVRPHVLEMSEGMREYTARADKVGKLRLTDLDDLERYCFYVAGTVGNLLTALFEQTVPVLPEAVRNDIRERSVSFGLGLQMVNIVKDVATDILRGDIFLPEQLAEAHGIQLEDLLAPQKRQAALAVVRAVTARARTHLQAAAEYTVLWPAEQAQAVRMFCAVPLALALASLTEVEHSKDTLRPGFVPKISREMVAGLFGEIAGAVDDDDKLLEIFARCAMPPEGVDHTDDVHVPRRPPVPEGDRRSARPTPRIDGGAPKKADEAEAAPAPTSEGKVLVTGAAGHLGANMVRRLLREGREVKVLLREGSNNAAMDGLDVERVFGDLRSAEGLEAATKGCDAVFHCAASVSTVQGDAKKKRLIYESNVLGTRNLLRAAGEAGVRRTVVTGSLEAVGYDLDDPQRPASEDVPVYPFDRRLPYSRTKELVEHEVLRAVADGLDVVVATSAAIVGPHDYKPSQLGRLLLDFAHGKLHAYIPGGFECVRAEDLCSGHLLALERGRTGHKYNLSTEFMSVSDLMSLYEEVSGRARPRVELPPEVMAGFAKVADFVTSRFMPNREQRFTTDAVEILRMQRRADITKAKEELGYAPTSVRLAVHEAYSDFARRGLVPSGPTMVSVPDAPAPKEGEDKDKTAAA